MVTFSELCPLTVYSCSIFAFTVAAGPTSPAINVSTAKSGIASIYHTVSYSATKCCTKLFRDIQYKGALLKLIIRLAIVICLYCDQI